MSAMRNWVSSGVVIAALGFGATANADESAAVPEVREVMPLAAVLDRIMPAIEGELGASRLIKDHGVWVYVIGVFDENGKPQELRVDAETAQILGIKP